MHSVSKIRAATRLIKFKNHTLLTLRYEIKEDVINCYETKNLNKYYVNIVLEHCSQSISANETLTIRGLTSY